MGEALSLRARQAQQLDDLRGRIKANALAQEGETPSEDADELIAVFERVSDEHSELVRRIAFTNATSTPAGLTGPMLGLLHVREALRRRRGVYVQAANAATPSRDQFRYMRSELRYVPAVDVAEYRKKAEELDKEIQALDAQIQEMNWKLDLL